jgi:DNA-binding NtrC family response regulator
MPDNTPAGFDPDATRILVVEDDEQFRLSVKRALELHGNQVSLFSDAESALESLSAIAPAVILTDLRLPRADGLFLLERVRERDPDLPVVLMTGRRLRFPGEAVQPRTLAGCDPACVRPASPDQRESAAQTAARGGLGDRPGRAGRQPPRA